MVFLSLWHLIPFQAHHCSKHKPQCVGLAPSLCSSIHNFAFACFSMPCLTRFMFHWNIWYGFIYIFILWLLLWMGSLPDVCAFLAQKKNQGLSAEPLCSSHPLNTDTVLVFQGSPALPANIQDHHSRSEISSAKSLRIVMHKWPWPAKLNVLTPRGLIWIYVASSSVTNKYKCSSAFLHVAVLLLRSRHE